MKTTITKQSIMNKGNGQTIQLRQTKYNKVVLARWRKISDYMMMKSLKNKI